MMNYEYQDTAQVQQVQQVQQAFAWLAVYNTLDQHANSFMQNDSSICGRELAVKAIKDMAETIKVQEVAIKYLTDCIIALTK